MPWKKGTGQNGLQAKWEKELGMPMSDPNFETRLRAALSNKPVEVQRSTLIVLGFTEVPTKHCGFEAGTIPTWLQKEK